MIEHDVITLIVSGRSQHCQYVLQQTKDLREKHFKGIFYVFDVDNAVIQHTVTQLNDYAIRYVPTLMIFKTNGTVEKFEKGKVAEWFDYFLIKNPTPIDVDVDTTTGAENPQTVLKSQSTPVNKDRDPTPSKQEPQQQFRQPNPDDGPYEMMREDDPGNEDELTNLKNLSMSEKIQLMQKNRS